MAADTYSITDLAREFGVTARTLRFYESEGLLKPTRQGASRRYSKADHARLKWVLRGRAVGFSLAEIRELLDLYAPGPARRPQLEAARARSLERIAALKEQRAAIDETLLELEAFVASLDAQLGEPAPA
ncbi:MerR family transcriptional regulator [Thermaurantiacus sp.]